MGKTLSLTIHPTIYPRKGLVDEVSVSYQMPQGNFSSRFSEAKVDISWYLKNVWKAFPIGNIKFKIHFLKKIYLYRLTKIINYYWKYTWFFETKFIYDTLLQLLTKNRKKFLFRYFSLGFIKKSHNFFKKCNIYEIL